MKTPYLTPVVLTDALFTQYGGVVGTATPELIAASILTAEQQTSNYFGTYLIPTEVTEYHPYVPGNVVISTELGYVHSITSVSVVDVNKVELWQVTGDVGYSYISDDTFGYVRIVPNVYSPCISPCGVDAPRWYKIVYTAGLPLGVATSPAFLVPLVMAAQITLNEITFPVSNESTGDIGVTEFETLEYKEKRKQWRRTAFGDSPKAAKIAQLFDNIMPKARKAVVLK